MRTRSRSDESGARKLDGKPGESLEAGAAGRDVRAPGAGLGEEWADIQQGAYRALGSPYGDDDDALLRSLKAHYPLERRSL
jgi:hypothetical protein